MKKLLASATALFFTTLLFASTCVWKLYTNDGSRWIILRNTTWVSENDGERIFFDREDGSGSFEDGTRFTYSPPVYRYNGMTTCEDEPKRMLVRMNGKEINQLRLGLIRNKMFLVDKRGIKYFRAQ